jgi:hypothetical protein
MTAGRSGDVPASVRRRLLNRIRASGEDFQLLLLRHAFERLLYRLSRSSYRDWFILKGAMLFPVLSDEPHRPTRDLDLLGRGDHDAPEMERAFRTIVAEPVEDDGVLFDIASVRAGVIREGQEYEGVRVELLARIGTARLPLQVDIGFGDAVTPAAQETEYPTLLDDFPRPILRVYPKETVVAEKYQAMVALGLSNSRMKDFYDAWVLARSFSFDGMLLAAIGATFERRRTSLPAEIPLALTDIFATDSTKAQQWLAFVRRGRLVSDLVSLGVVIDALSAFLWPPTESLRDGKTFAMAWAPGGPWRPVDHGTGAE